ncbi:kinase-like protein, partial [Clavulina sp. PMI_390]
LVHREAVTHSQLKHKNILGFLGVYQEADNSPPLTIVPFIEGGSLQSLLTSDHSLSAQRFQRIVSCQLIHLLAKQVIGISDGLQYLHSFRPAVIHGDLHPGNVLLFEHDCPCLCDFGQSRIRHEVTRTRTDMGRKSGGQYRFLAPELTKSPLDKFRTTPKSDVYALAMLSLNIWTGEKPFAEIELEWQVCVGVVGGQRPKKPDRAQVPIPEEKKAKEFYKLLEKMWAQDPAKRPAIEMVCGRFKEIFENS